MTINMEEIQILDTPLPLPSLITLLSQHLPYSLPVLRRLQCAANFPSNGLGTTPYSHCLFASRHSLESFGAQPQADEKRKHFAAAFVDLSRFPETQVWVYSTLEDYGVFDPEAGSRSLRSTGAALGEGLGEGQGERGGFGAQSHSLPEEEARGCDELMLNLLRRMRTIAEGMPRELERVSEQRQRNWAEAREYLMMNRSTTATDGTAGTGAVSNGDSEGSEKTSNGNSDEKTRNGDTNETNNSGPGPKIMIGSLAEIHRHRLFLSSHLNHNVKMHKTFNIPDDIDWEVCQKWLFRVESLLYSPDKQAELERVMKEEGLVWDQVRTKEDVRLVQSRTAIKRQEDTLLGLPSVAIRKNTGGKGALGEMVGWGFMALDGTLMTLHVEEEYRGKGLAKAVACKVMRDHIKDYGDDGWGAADVFVDNVRSQGVCRSIGGRVGWLLSWAVVDLSTVGDAI